MTQAFRSVRVVLLLVAGVLVAGCSTCPCSTEKTTMPTASTDAASPAPSPVKDWKRIAIVSHSLSDGNTWPYLLRQALVEAGRPEPYLINAAAGGDMAAASLRRFDWATLRFNPDLVIFFIGRANVGQITADEYQAAMTEMITRAQAQGADILLMVGRMPFPGIGPSEMGNDVKAGEIVARQRAKIAADTGEPLIDLDNPPANRTDDQILRALAARYNCMVCETTPPMVDAFEQRIWLWEPDLAHWNFEGYQAALRGVLDGLGYKNVAVPRVSKIRVIPGLITTWKLRPFAAGEANLTEETVVKLAPGDGWKTYTLPEEKPLGSWWEDQCRVEGYAMSLAKTLGQAKRYVGVATYRAESAGKAFVNTGGHLQAVWVNGKKIFQVGLWDGFHIGTHRIEVDMNAGDNTIVIETGTQFGLSITPGLLW